MKFLFVSLVILIGCISNAQVFKDATSPCRPLRESCMQAGFVLNDKTPGNKLIKDCILILAEGKTAQNKITNKVAQAPAGSNVNACKATIQRKTMHTVGMKSSRRVNIDPKGFKAPHPITEKPLMSKMRSERTARTK